MSDLDDGDYVNCTHCKGNCYPRFSGLCGFCEKKAVWRQVRGEYHFRSEPELTVRRRKQRHLASKARLGFRMLWRVV